MCPDSSYSVGFRIANFGPPQDVSFTCYEDGNEIGEGSVFLETGETTEISEEFTYPGACREPIQYVCTATAGENTQCPESVSDTCYVRCAPDCEAVACPRTIGFWRQQCKQRGNGSQKLCQEAMEQLWACVLEKSEIRYWTMPDGTVMPSGRLTAEDWCALLKGPRPMTKIGMAQAQLLAVCLNVCGRLLSPAVLYDDGNHSATVEEIVKRLARMVDAWNDDDPDNDPSVRDLNRYKSLVDEINNGRNLDGDECDEDPLVRLREEFCPDRANNGHGQKPSGLGLRARPNPSESGHGTVIYYAVPDHLAGQRLSLEVFDVNGRLVRRLMDTPSEPGEFSVTWDLRDGSGSTVSDGVYFYRIQIGPETQTKRLIVIQ